MKIKVFLPMHIFILLIFVIGDLAVWLDIILNGLNQMDTLSWILVGAFAGALPLIVIIWSTLTMANTIVFDEHGVSRKRFGRTIRHFDWAKVKTFSSTSGDKFIGWIYISDIEKSFNSDMMSTTKMQFDKNVIYFHQSKKAQKAIEKFMPYHLKNQVQ